MQVPLASCPIAAISDRESGVGIPATFSGCDTLHGQEMLERLARIMKSSWLSIRCSKRSRNGHWSIWLGRLGHG